MPGTYRKQLVYRLQAAPQVYPVQVLVFRYGKPNNLQVKAAGFLEIPSAGNRIPSRFAKNLTAYAHHGSNTPMRELTVQFQISPSSGVPIYRQIMDQVRALIQSGRWPIGSMVPSVRQMATDLEINAMTVSKAYSRLEIEGVLEHVRGTGMRIKQLELLPNPTAENSVSVRKKQLKPAAVAFFAQGQQLGLSPEQSLSVAKRVAQEIIEASNNTKVPK